MLPDFSLFPDEASTFAGRVDTLFFFILGVTLFFSVLVAFLVIYFAVKYRRRSEEIPPRITSAPRMETAWLVFLIVLFLTIFFWGARSYFSMARPPDDAMEVYVVGTQWMWKIQHPDGAREINELTIPVGKP